LCIILGVFAASMTPAQHAELAQLRAELDELRLDDRTRQRH